MLGEGFTLDLWKGLISMLYDLNKNKNILLYFTAPPAIHSPRLPAKSIVVETIATTITCAFESIPSSNITWSYDSGVIGVASQKVKKEGKYFITIGTLYIETPMASMNGKNINCTGKSSIGSPVTQKTILAVEGKTSFHHKHSVHRNKHDRC